MKHNLKQKKERAFPPFPPVTTVDLQQLFRLLQTPESKEPNKTAVDKQKISIICLLAYL
jgi:hypothetical protein